ncbi:hypothetical protein TrLO_g5659 [Triparma laevis f. longispina]|uniref:Cytochrome b561 domain-containing protein n=1 Tax=Triparma laevis f. longispina TaxID=1714387 RepID=A0A9W7CCW3_9STRA|nr:hypothetical protein TrLO_g5659 [Triparma laevis f. longispina]
MSTICFQGYVMDKYCIDRGTMLDYPTKSTLEFPELHSVHCLIDVPICYSSGFEVLKDPEESGGKRYCRAYELDTNGNNMVTQLGREEGSCSTCDGDGTIEKGLRVRVVGALGGVGTPQVLNVDSVTLATVGGCDSFGGETVPSNLSCTGGGQRDLVKAHGALMMISWGFLLPLGVILARFLKHREGGVWFKLHRAIQCTGLLLAIAGFIIALTQFDVFTAEGINLSKIHGTFGIIVMTLGILQPVNAFFRPHVEPQTKSRLLWEKLHKGSGRFAIILAVLTIFLGTTRVAFVGDKTGFQIGYLCVLILLAAVGRMFQLEGKGAGGGGHKVVEVVGGEGGEEQVGIA